MNTKQKQNLLAFLGLYEGIIDGIWGVQSQHALEAFQTTHGLPVGDFTEATRVALQEAVATWQPESHSASSTGAFWDEIEFFDREEFRCQCGGKYCNGFPVEPQEKLVRTIDEIRRRLGVPVSIVDAGGSGVRCRTHNANVGGAVNSLHITGNAADLHSSKSPQEMRRVAEEVLGSTGELGIYNWGIHVGIGAYSRFSV